ncbi:unnamed protein product [Rhizoctonia solani]|nr:unnamed protein product [Rhizoctonia solani]
MLIAIKIMDTVYLQGRQKPETENDSIANLHKLLESWYKDLPDQIQMPPPSGAPLLPHTIVLHITYWWLFMLLHRPFSFHVQSPSGASSWPTSTVFADLSADICERAAKNVVYLVAIFDQTYGCRFFPLNMLQAIFMVGTTLLGRYATFPGSANRQHTDARSMAQECIRALRAASQTWEAARLYASQLEALLSKQIPRSSLDSLPHHLYMDGNSYSYHSGGDAYQHTAPEHDDTMSRMFQDFIDHHEQDAEELGIPLVAEQFEFSLPQQFSQPQPEIPSGSRFITNADAPPLQLTDESEFPEAVEHGTGA